MSSLNWVSWQFKGRRIPLLPRSSQQVVGLDPFFLSSYFPLRPCVVSLLIGSVFRDAIAPWMWFRCSLEFTTSSMLVETSRWCCDVFRMRWGFERLTDEWSFWCFSSAFKLVMREVWTSIIDLENIDWNNAFDVAACQWIKMDRNTVFFHSMMSRSSHNPPKDILLILPNLQLPQQYSKPRTAILTKLAFAVNM